MFKRFTANLLATPHTTLSRRLIPKNSTECLVSAKPVHHSKNTCYIKLLILDGRLKNILSTSRSSNLQLVYYSRHGTIPHTLQRVTVWDRHKKEFTIAVKPSMSEPISSPQPPCFSLRFEESQNITCTRDQEISCCTCKVWDRVLSFIYPVETTTLQNDLYTQ